MALMAYPYIKEIFEFLHDVNVTTFTSNTYSDILDYKDEH